MIEPGEIKKCYQWKTGFWAGHVEAYLAETEDTVFFESGRSVKKDSLDQNLVQISEEMYFESSEAAKAKKTLEDQWNSLMDPPSNNLSSIPLMETPSQPIPTPQPTPIEKSPIQIILERQKKKEKKTIQIEIEVSVPGEKVIDLLTTMFDEDEVFEEIVSSSIDITEDELRKLIHQSIIKQLRSSDE